MLRRTFGSVKDSLRRVVGSTGMNTSDPRLMDYVNRAIEELMPEGPGGSWPTTVDRLKFQLTQCKFVLPSDYDRMLYCTVNDVPQQMQSPWFEFVGFGMELLNLVSSPVTNLDRRFEGVIDKDNAATFEDIPDDGNEYVLRVYAQTDERVDGVQPNIVIQGYDANGDWIRSSDGAGGFIDGVSVPINGDTAPYYIQTTQTFSTVTATIKPVTKKNVMVYAQPVALGTATYIGQYAAGDTTPLYRQYSIPGLAFTDNNPTRVVLARCLHKFVPIRTDADFLLISNLPALETMIQAVYYRECNDPDSYAKFKLVAIDILKKESKAYIGLSNQKPLMTISEGAGMRGDALYIL